MELPPTSPGASAELKYFAQLHLQLVCSFTVRNLTFTIQLRFLNPENYTPLHVLGMLILEPTH